MEELHTDSYDVATLVILPAFYKAQLAVMHEALHHQTRQLVQTSPRYPKQLTMKNLYFV